MKKYLPFIILVSFFLILKITNLGIRLSDTNIYFYTGYSLLQGKVLYKDIFFTNFPLLPYVSSLYYLLTFKQLPLFYFTAAIEAAVTGFLLYQIALKQTKQVLLAAVNTAIYLFSFIILATSEHQTGVFLASLFAVASYYFYLEKKFLLTGIFISLALLTKAYFLPIFIAYIVMFFLGFKRGGESEKKSRHPGVPLSGTIGSQARHSGLPAGRHGLSRISWDSIASLQNDKLREVILFLIGFSLTIFIILLPSLFFAPNEFIKDVFQYSLTRSQGVDKTNILWFFITHDLLLFLTLIYSMIMVRKHLFFGLVSISGVIFFFLYQDIYYLYLNFLIPFLCLAFANFYQDIEKRLSLQRMVLPTIIFIFLTVNFFVYLSGYRNLQKFENLDVLVQTIKQINPPSLYGINSLTPVLAYLSNKPLLNDIVDTNPNIYRKGFLNASTLTKQAIDEKSLFVVEGLSYPEMGVQQDITGEIFDVNQMKNCRVVQSIPIKTEGAQNRINLVSCQ